MNFVSTIRSLWLTTVLWTTITTWRLPMFLHHDPGAHASHSKFRLLISGFWIINCILEGHSWSNFFNFEVAVMLPIVHSSHQKICWPLDRKLLLNRQESHKFSNKIAQMVTLNSLKLQKARLIFVFKDSLKGPNKHGIMQGAEGEICFGLPGDRHARRVSWTPCTPTLAYFALPYPGIYAYVLNSFQSFLRALIKAACFAAFI